MTQMSLAPLTSKWVPNRMCVPSGDQSGLRASRKGSVRRLGAPPFAFITHTAEMYPPLVLLKAILWPSGEYSGPLLTQSPPRIFFTFVPSAFMTSISQYASNLSEMLQREKTILVPSGDHEGCSSLKSSC